jgi:hypothetical protein
MAAMKALEQKRSGNGDAGKHISDNDFNAGPTMPGNAGK